MPNPGYNNLILIQKVFAHCYISSVDTEQEFKRITENKESNFSYLDTNCEEYKASPLDLT